MSRREAQIHLRATPFSYISPEDVGVACEHPREAMEWVEEKALSGVCRCSACGREFHVKGWLNRGTGDPQRLAGKALEGFGGGVLRGLFRSLKP